MESSSKPELGYAEFGDWYDRYRSAVLEPALDLASSLLEATLGDALSDRELARIRNVTGRVKSKQRTWRKVRQPRYADRIATVEDIPKVIDDLIGLRVACTNLRDIDMVQAALDNLPRRRRNGRRLWLDPTSERDYVVEPKESGYRGWHVNLGIAVNPDDPSTVLTAELQVRTVLQDSWGELTHEDTYSKDGALPPLVEVLSKRMADLFSTLDDIAEDLRTELDRLDEAAVAETETVDPVAGTDSDQADSASGQADDAAQVLVERWQSLDRPTDLASLAWTLQRDFGAEITDDWFGYRNFKRFLLHAVPDGEISTGRQAYLLPRGYAPDADANVDEHADDADSTPPETGTDAPPSERAADAAIDTRQADTDTAEGAKATVPEQARLLRRIDRSFPLLDAEQWPRLYDQLAKAWHRLGTREPSTRLVNQLSRSARDSAEATGEAVSRRHLDYVAKALLSASDTGEPLDKDRIAQQFTAITVQRMTDLRVLDPKHRKARTSVERWLNGGNRRDGSPRR